MCYACFVVTGPPFQRPSLYGLAGLSGSAFGGLGGKKQSINSVVANDLWGNNYKVGRKLLRLYPD